MELGIGIEPIIYALQVRRIASNASEAKMVVPTGVEPVHGSNLERRRHKLPVLPLHQGTMVRKVGVGPTE